MYVIVLTQSLHGAPSGQNLHRVALMADVGLKPVASL